MKRVKVTQTMRAKTAQLPCKRVLFSFGESAHGVASDDVGCHRSCCICATDDVFFKFPFHSEVGYCHLPSSLVEEDALRLDASIVL